MQWQGKDDWSEVDGTDSMSGQPATKVTAPDYIERDEESTSTIVPQVKDPFLAVYSWNHTVRNWHLKALPVEKGEHMIGVSKCFMMT